MALAVTASTLVMGCLANIRGSDDGSDAFVPSARDRFRRSPNRIEDFIRVMMASDQARNIKEAA